MFPALLEEYLTPTTLEDAIVALTRNAEARVIAGGMSLMQLVKSRQARPRCLIDLQRVESLRQVRVDASGVSIGAMVRHRDVAVEPRLSPAYAALSDAAAVIGDRQVRNRGTIGGNLCFNDIASDLPPAVLALGAELAIAGPDGRRRTMQAGDFFRGPREVAMAAGEILTAVMLPPWPARSGSAYLKYGFTVDGPPVVGVAAAVRLDEAGRCAAAAIAVGGILPGPRRLAAAEHLLIGRPSADEGARDEAAAAAQAIDTQTDLWADAPYRKALLRQLTRQALARAVERASGGTRP
jgi:aerobic carbon-monoxide dehydrogenase medium subunit